MQLAIELHGRINVPLNNVIYKYIKKRNNL